MQYILVKQTVWLFRVVCLAREEHPRDRDLRSSPRQILSEAKVAIPCAMAADDDDELFEWGAAAAAAAYTAFGGDDYRVGSSVNMESLDSATHLSVSCRARPNRDEYFTT